GSCVFNFATSAGNVVCRRTSEPGTWGRGMTTRLERSRHDGADVRGRVRTLAKGIGFSQLLILPPENGLHEFAGIGIGVGHWPVETFGHCQLPGGALLAEMA